MAAAGCMFVYINHLPYTLADVDCSKLSVFACFETAVCFSAKMGVFIRSVWPAYLMLRL